MKLKLKDRMTNFIEAKVDILNLVRDWFPEYVPDGNVICPFHDDTNVSLHISPEGKAKCHGCEFMASSIVDLFSKMEDIPFMEARTMLYEDVVNALPMSRVKKQVRLRQQRPALYLYLNNERNLEDSILDRYMLGYEVNSNRITIPVLDQFGSCVNIRKLAWEGKSKCKMVNEKNHGEVRLFPEQDIIREQRILLVEGEMDVLVGRRFGLSTCTWTGGATSINLDYLWMFKDKLVFILYDNDKAGREGMQQQVEALTGVALQVIVLDPLMPRTGKDLTDWSFKRPDKLRRLAKDMQNHKLIMRPRKDVCPCCGRSG